MSNHEMPYAEPKYYVELKIWENGTIQGYEIKSFMMIEDSDMRAGWNVNFKLRTDDQGFTMDTLFCDGLKNNLEEQFKERRPEAHKAFSS